MSEVINYLIAQEMYSRLRLYEADKNDVPFWKLTDKEVAYYKWLFSKDEYLELRKVVSLSVERS